MTPPFASSLEAKEGLIHSFLEKMRDFMHFSKNYRMTPPFASSGRKKKPLMQKKHTLVKQWMHFD
jgi:hypothetical protein